MAHDHAVHTCEGVEDMTTYNLATMPMGAVTMYAMGTRNACGAPKSETVENSCMATPDTMNNMATMTQEIVQPGDIDEVCDRCRPVCPKDMLVNPSRKWPPPPALSACIVGAANRINDAPPSMLRAW
jgi:hypothetical protein